VARRPGRHDDLARRHARAHRHPGAAAPQRSLAWDGRVLRITRTEADAAAGLRVVAWARRAGDGQWLRWQSAPVQSQQAWQSAWDAAARWAEAGAAFDSGNPNASVVAVASTLDWQLHYFRGNAWTNPLSSPAQDSTSAQALPDAVRLLTLAPGQPSAARSRWTGCGPISGLAMKRPQSGAALLMAMITVALVAILAAGALWRQWRGVEVERAERARSPTGC
jgi:hypothetical protein